MGKAEKEHMLRLEGMEYALSIAKEKGIDGLEKEVRRRSKKYVPLSISTEEINQFSEKVKANVFNNSVIMWLVTLRDEFDFGEDRCLRAQRRFWKKAECLTTEYTDLDEQVSILADEVNIEAKVKDDDVTVKINRRQPVVKVSAKDVGITVK